MYVVSPGDSAGLLETKVTVTINLFQDLTT